MTNKTQPTAHAEITAPISADLRRIDDAGAQPAPAQLPKTLRELAEVVHDWGKRDQAWAHPDPDCFDVALFGHISEDGEPYPVAEVNADTYGHEGVSLQLAQFYAAASPTAVLALLDRVELRDNELKAARADIKHWRSNHDNVVARLRIFTQRPDIPKELADRLPWYRELVRLQEVEAQALPSVVVGPLAERGILDAIRSAYDLGYNDARSARAVPGDSAPGYKGRQVEGDHGGALVHLLKKLQAAPPAPAAVAVPDEGEIFEAWVRTHEDAHGAFDDGSARTGWEARAALAAGPAQAQDDRAAFKAYLQECDDCEIVPDVAGAFHAAWQKRAAPAQAVASSITIDFKQAAELLEMFGGEPAEVTLMMGDGHSGNGLYASYTDMPEEGAGFLGTSDNEALHAAPAQEHATQLAGQALPADEFRGDTASLVRNIVALLDLDAQGCLVPHGVGGHARGLLSAAASRLAAPAQAQEDAPDPVRALIATHAEMLEDNAYAYFELAYTRQTGWMAWITDKPLYGAPVVNPDRKVLANGQGDTPDEACADAARAAQGSAE